MRKKTLGPWDFVTFGGNSNSAAPRVLGAKCSKAQTHKLLKTLQFESWIVWQFEANGL